jgi:hypothetical protein
MFLITLFIRSAISQIPHYFFLSVLELFVRFNYEMSDFFSQKLSIMSKQI